MKAIRTSTTLAAFLLLSFSAATVPARAQSGNAADEAAIKQLIAGNTQAFNKHDAHGVAADFVEDADFTNMRGVSQHSRKSIEAFLTPLFATGALKSASRTLTVRSVRFFSPTIAEVDIDSVLVGTTTASGKENPPRKGLVNDVVSKQNGKWMITVFHELDYPEAPPAPGK